ncbi:MAG: hypothetical protein M1835_006686 [Candelina submexicana]|nr:MAG: hypothetical protein M1835_006686 [Candelina submexicana]
MDPPSHETTEQPSKPYRPTPSTAVHPQAVREPIPTTTHLRKHSASLSPNFEGVDPRDGLPCHISHAQLAQRLERAFNNNNNNNNNGGDSAPTTTTTTKAHNVTEAVSLATKLQDMMTKHFYASQQPLTAARVLPDGANLRFAARGSVEGVG